MSVHHTARRKVNRYQHIRKSNDKCISQRILAGVNAVVMSYKTDIRHNKNWPARYCIVLHGQTPLFSLLFVVVKMEKTRCGHTRLCTRVAMEEGLLSV